MRWSFVVRAAAGVLIAPALTVSFAPPAGAQDLMCGGLPATLRGDEGANTIIGTPGDDVIVAGSGFDTVDGGAGNDVICGGRGPDRLVGGEGNDLVKGNRGGDALAGGDGDDLLKGGSGIQASFAADAGDDVWISRAPVHMLSFTGAPNGVTVDVEAGTAEGWGHDTFTLPSSDTLVLTGSEHDDILLGSSEAETIYGAGGADAIAGRGGSDRLASGSATRVATTTPEGPSASLEGGPGDDELMAGVAGAVSGGTGDDKITVPFSSGTPLTSDLVLDGGAGQDRLWLYDATPAGQGVLVDGVYDHISFDMLAGSLDADALHLDPSAFEIFLFETVDWHTVSTDFDVTGTDGPDGIYVASVDIYGTSIVSVHAGPGDDRIQSGGGDDTLDGGPGWDRADAQNGIDTCISIETGLNDDRTDCEIRTP
jgi:Ca2+-binding RTX toxin-like protein